LNREISIMRDIRHPHVIRLLDVFDEEFAGIYLVQEYAEVSLHAVAP
jgi:serine/threonine protein kinase